MLQEKRPTATKDDVHMRGRLGLTPKAHGGAHSWHKTSYVTRRVSHLGAFLTLAFLAAPAGGAVFHPETIAWWQFEPGSFTTDSSGNGNSLTTSGVSGSSGAVLSGDTAFGAGNGSAYFDGNAIMQTIGTLNLAPYGHIAVSWWQKVDSTDTVVLWEHSANYNQNTGGLIGVANEPDYTPAYVAMRGNLPIMDTFPYSNSTWQHFTAQINLGLPAGSVHEAIKVYQDGKLVGADRLTASLPAVFRNDTLYLGSRAGAAATLGVLGNLDEVKLETVSTYVNDVANHTNLIGYWRLGESNGPTAWEVKGAVGNGTYANTTATDYARLGAVNYDLDTAMRFNGTTSYVNAGNHAELNGDWNGLTISAWVKPESESLAGVRMIAGKWANSATQDHFALFLSGGKVGIAVADGVYGENGVFSQATLNADEWYFLAGTWDAATRRYQLYINGELDPATGTQTGNGINMSSTTTLKIGAQVTGQPRYFAGLIDEVAIFNTALSGDDLMAYYLTATVPEPSSILLVIMACLGLFGRRRRR